MSEQNHPINEVLNTTMSRIREMVDTNTVVGQPIVTADGVTLIPVSKLSFGFATGGSDFGKTPNVEKNFGGGAGAGVNVTPVAFLIQQHTPRRGVHEHRTGGRRGNRSRRRA